jgi:hypothetical protein
MRFRQKVQELLHATTDLGFVSQRQIVSSHVRQSVGKSPETYALARLAKGLETAPSLPLKDR